MNTTVFLISSQDYPVDFTRLFFVEPARFVRCLFILILNISKVSFFLLSAFFPCKEIRIKSFSFCTLFNIFYRIIKLCIVFTLYTVWRTENLIRLIYTVSRTFMYFSSNISILDFYLYSSVYDSILLFLYPTNSTF